MKIMFTAETRPRSASGVRELDRGLAHHHAHLVGGAGQHVERDRERERAREPEADAWRGRRARPPTSRAGPARPTGRRSSSTTDIASAPISSDEVSRP